MKVDKRRIGRKEWMLKREEETKIRSGGE